MRKKLNTVDYFNENNLVSYESKKIQSNTNLEKVEFMKAISNLQDKLYSLKL
jgi:hypothetical protein